MVKHHRRLHGPRVRIRGFRSRPYLRGTRGRRWVPMRGHHGRIGEPHHQQWSSPRQPEPNQGDEYQEVRDNRGMMQPGGTSRGAGRGRGQRGPPGHREPEPEVEIQGIQRRPYLRGTRGARGVPMRGHHVPNGGPHFQRWSSPRHPAPNEYQEVQENLETILPGGGTSRGAGRGRGGLGPPGHGEHEPEVGIRGIHRIPYLRGIRGTRGMPMRGHHGHNSGPHNQQWSLPIHPEPYGEWHERRDGRPITEDPIGNRSHDWRHMSGNEQGCRREEYQELRGSRGTCPPGRRERPGHREHEPEKIPSKRGRREIKPLSPQMLRRLQKERPADALQKLYENLEPLETFLAAQKISNENMRVLIDVLNKICVANNQRSERTRDILLILQKQSFLDCKLTHWIGNWERLIATKEECERNVLLVIDILTNILRDVPAASSSIGVVLVLLNNAIKRFEQEGISNEVVDGLAALSKERSDLLRLGSRDMNPQGAPGGASAPRDFRKCPILPLSSELKAEYRPILRTNIVDGKYQDVDHYLDIHFRLLREDFVKPLREGIAEYTAEVTRQRRSVKTRLQNIRLYMDVKAVAMNPSEYGLSVLLQFDMGNHLEHVRWRVSKRLIFGSLVCLSRDNFASLFFGVVCNRSPEKLEKGLIEVNFVLEPEEALDLFSHSFLMAESSSYFEAYRHILKCLQLLNVGSFPFKKYVIDMASDPALPKYLNMTTACIYDLSHLAVEQQDGSVPVNLGNVCINSNADWPSAESLGFDTSQMEAYQSALTQEFCLIQGPPGTGKTYVGLKIVQTLLENKERRGQCGPLLVVCYTNHALDQFLEGILQFDQRVVRIGGRSRNEFMANLNITKVTRDARKSGRSINKATISKLLGNMRKCAMRTSNYRPLITASHEKLLKTEVLADFMQINHLAGLQQLACRTSLHPIPIWLKLYDHHGDLIHTEEQPHCSRDRYSDVPSQSRHRNGRRGREEAGNRDESNSEGAKDSRRTPVENESFAAGCTSGNDGDIDMLEDGEIRDDMDEGDEFRFGYLDDKDVTYDRLVEVPSLDPMDIVIPFPDSLRSREQVSTLDGTIRLNLFTDDVMTKQEAERVTDIWDLPMKDRWRLYRHWKNSYVKELHQKVRGIFTEYNRDAAKLKELRTEEKYEALKGTSVIGVTTSGAAKNNQLLRRISPPIVIVEEAAEILEAHVITSLTEETQHVILIGDHQQLRPNPTVYELCKDFKLDVSLFERMVRNGMPCHRLTLQHRMRPEISHILKLHQDFYPGLRDHVVVQSYEHVLGVERDVFFVDHEIPEQHDNETKSRSNTHEASFLASLCTYLLQQGYPTGQITILTAYKGQAFLLKQMLSASRFEGIRVCTVDNFQGEENDIILFSSVRSNAEGNIGFLKISNRICVALSRAKKGLYCIGNFSMMSEQSEVWRVIIGDLKTRGLIGTSLKLLCSNHPQNIIEVSSALDFNDNVPEGGCQELCSARLNCGHTCQKRCHPSDREHRNMPCSKPCEREICVEGHTCPKKCSEPCPGHCMKKVKVELPCGHEDDKSCYQKPEDVECSHRCDRLQPCGHKCPRRCYQRCVERCAITVEKTFGPCGHRANVPCHQMECPEPCQTLLKCGHKCQGRCDECSNGRYHAQCREKCTRILVCGHACDSFCSRSCPPCMKRCEDRCEHSKCQKRCGEKCVPCKEPCEWKCRHSSCTRLCGEDCDRERCDLNCQEVLECGHPCIGLCGETCPKLCRDCHQSEVTTLLFGTEDEPNARFISLANCGHIVEVTALDKLMEGNQSSEENAIKLPECPWCKTPIRYNMRYSKVLNAYKRDVEDVKEKIKGEEERITSTCKALEARCHSDLAWLRMLPARPRVITRFIRCTHPDKDHMLPDESFCHCFETLAPQLRQPHYTLSMDHLQRIRIYLDIYDKVSELSEVKLGTLDDSTAKEVDIGDSYGRFCKLYSFLLLKTKAQLSKSSPMSEQEVDDWRREFSRCNLSLDMLKLDAVFQKGKMNLQEHEEEKAMIDSINQLLSNGFPFTEDKETEVRASLEKLQKFDPSLTKMGITAKEKGLILGAMGFSRKGHWFKCPNGHVYAIGECGGAMQKSVCPECKTDIGGQNHHLDDSNQLAPEMDGASFAAYSEAANDMMNFNLLEEL